jgi:hypothetical protein
MPLPPPWALASVMPPLEIYVHSSPSRWRIPRTFRAAVCYSCRLLHAARTVSLGMLARMDRQIVAVNGHSANKWAAVSMRVCEQRTHVGVAGQPFFWRWPLCTAYHAVITIGRSWHMAGSASAILDEIPSWVLLGLAKAIYGVNSEVMMRTPSP